LGALLQQHQTSTSADDLRALYDRFEGPSIAVRGVTVADLRLTREGFRISLLPDPDTSLTTEGDLAIPGLADADGAYLVEYDGRLRATPSTPPALRFDGGIVDDESLELEELKTARLRVPIANDGLEDAHDAVLAAVFQQAGEATTVTTTVPLVPGEGSADALVEWVPPEAGTWDVGLTITAGTSWGGQMGESHTQLSVSPADRASAPELVRLDSTPAAAFGVAGLFAATLLVVTATGVLLWRSGGRGEGQA
jgi:hypothetical protein